MEGRDQPTQGPFDRSGDQLIPRVLPLPSVWAPKVVPGAWGILRQFDWYVGPPIHVMSMW
jgi:hypothetical protein